MKWSFIGLGLALVNLAAAAAVPHKPNPSCAPGSPKLYKLLVKSTNPVLNNRYLSTGSGEQSIGLYSDVNKSPDYTATPLVSSSATATEPLIELHDRPAGIIDYVLAVQRVVGDSQWYIMDEPASFSNPRIQTLYKEWKIKDGFLTYKFPSPITNPDSKVWYLYKYAADTTTYTIRWRSDGVYDADYHPIKIQVVDPCHH